jgi:sugar lactone lactonase YvrE
MRITRNFSGRPPARPCSGAGAVRRMVLASLWLGLLCLLCSCASLGSRETDAEPSFVFYPAPPLEPRIQFLASYSSDADVLPPMSRFQRLLVGEREAQEIAKPYGVSIHEGRILVCDTKLGAVEIFDLQAQSVGLLGYDSTGRLRKPINITVDEEGNRYVADVILRRVMVYDKQNRFVRSYTGPEAWKPTDIAIDGRRLYVVDLDNGQVVVLERESGEEMLRFGRRGSGEGEFFHPTNVEVDAEGYVYVADTGNFRVVKLDRRGKTLRQFGTLGKGLGQFVRPKGIAVDREGRLYVADAAFEVVQIFDPEGELLLFFGGTGNQPGGMNIPAKVEIDYDNAGFFADRVAPGRELEYLILVTNQFGANKVNVYGFLKQSGRDGN